MLDSMYGGIEPLVQRSLLLRSRVTAVDHVLPRLLERVCLRMAQSPSILRTLLEYIVLLCCDTSRLEYGTTMYRYEPAVTVCAWDSLSYVHFDFTRICFLGLLQMTHTGGNTGFPVRLVSASGRAERSIFGAGAEVPASSEPSSCRVTYMSWCMCSLTGSNGRNHPDQVLMELWYSGT